MKQALLIVDVQHGMFRIDPPVYQGDRVIAVLQKLIHRAREAGVDVIYVQHNGGPGHLLELGKPEWKIHPGIAPQPGDLVVEKRRPDSFFQTVLEEELQKRGVTHLVIGGMQTEFCVDTTVRRAFSQGYDLTFVADGHSTWDNEWLTAQQIIDHHSDIMTRFADVKRAEEIVFFGKE
ncbi:cysteine hydrolase family protein [Tumebacillus flagellatus]|uniref:Isochorismatase n=1 Tax=Tumebacillus flagellatus TaxID=1157490 RepID=A0A074M607_9BACL|nr:cysteine hydrolase family protein [Tumebacillus flagellatus]KEO81447.1 isochorismatase [Tumebacillus flagellatus]